MNILAVIPAKSQSERVPNKNLALFGGKPLFLWTVDAALECKALTTIIVSTDSHLVADHCRGRAVTVDICPQVHAQDDARKVVVHHARYNMRWKFDIAVMLLPTSPFRSSEDIWAAIQAYRAVQVPLISVSEIEEKRKVRQLTDGRLGFPAGPLVRSNGAIQIDSMENILNGTPFNHEGAVPFHLPMPAGLDIDYPEDWERAKSYVNISELIA